VKNRFTVNGVLRLWSVEFVKIENDGWPFVLDITEERISG
jgi:hypothetical protein